MYSFKVKKRNVERTFQVPGTELNDGYSPWTAKDFKHFRFSDYLERGRATYRRGGLLVIFDDAGRAIEGYSYGACIFAYTEPSEDFRQGRLIWNDTKYSTLSSKHQSELHDFVCGEWQSRGYCSVYYAAGQKPWGYETMYYPAMDIACQLHSMPWVCDANMLRREITTWRYHQPQPEWAIERRIAGRAERKAQNLARRATARVCKANPGVINLDARRKANG